MAKKEIKVAAPKSGSKKMNLEKREEKDHKDFDHDGERGEGVKHIEKVLRVGKAKAEKIHDEKPAKKKAPTVKKK